MKDYTDIIIAPVITEKAATKAEANVYTFKVVKSVFILVISEFKFSHSSVKEFAKFV